ncbi:nucleolar protein 6 [Drosophila pseudoobscura]|uniref:nucleolar protein 6 n=1 Tax=Drosophila pseudoobscura TaxID=7237 RepID=UPI00143F3387|nr:nucleolar protein 6 [Drosophila pseudoobscura]
MGKIKKIQRKGPPATKRPPKAARTESADSALGLDAHSDLEKPATSSDDGFEEPTPKPKPSKKTTTLPGPVSIIAQKKNKFRTDDGKNVKPPTLEEMKELRDTRNLFHSNLFKLQVKEMLEEIQLKTKYTEYIDNWMESFTVFTQRLKDGLVEKSQLEVPLNVDKKISGFIFSKPTKEPQLIGAASTGTLLGPKIVVDVALEMPKDCLHKDDYLNLIYDQKRALYLTYVTNQMRSDPAYSQDNFAFNYHGNNPLKPVLELTPAAKQVSKHLQLRLFITAPQSTFKPGRFVPWNNNIRPTYYNDEWDEEEALPSTQHYNASVLFDLTLAQNQALLDKAFKGRRNFQDGLLLLKVWLRQRELDRGFTGFGSHILAAFIVYLNQQRILHQSSSSYQVARTVWNQLANTDWTNGITLAPASGQTEQLSTMAGYYDVCFMDVSGQLNLCANVPLGVYQRVRAEAKLAVDLLNDMKLNSFPYIFMQKCPLYTRVDNILKITNYSSIQQMLVLHSKPQMKYDFASYGYPQLLQILTELLQKGLKQRVQAILPIETVSSAWPVESKAPIIGQSIQLGLILDPEHAYEVLDKGPSSNDDPEGSAEFRKFWGDKSNLRRFQDGSITEAVVWGTTKDAPSKKRLIVRQIVMHLLEHHLQLDSKDIQYIAADLDLVYQLSPWFKVSKVKTKLELQQDTDAEALSPNVIRCYDDLARQLHALDDLPLEIVSISSISPVSRYCEPMPVLPQARMMADHIHASHIQRVIIQLGQSGKWPNELSALRALKTAFLIEIGEKLKAQCRLNWSITSEGLLVLKRGFCFLLELAHNKELALLKQEVTERGVTKYVDNPESRALEQRHYILPKVSGALHSLHQSHSAYGPTVLIAKRWLATQLLDDGIWPPMATELLVAHLYQQRNAPQAIAAPQTGFIRFLHLLAHSDWNGELFLLNFNSSWQEQQIGDLEHSFRSDRQSYPPLALATSYDQQHAGRLWTTGESPSLRILSHVSRLARHALEMIETSLQSKDLRFVRPAQLFRGSSEGYDLVIQLKSDLVPNALSYDLGSPFVSFDQPNYLLPRAGKDPLAAIVHQLRSAYSDYAAFFYNPHGGKELAIMWRPPAVFAPKAFKVTELQACTLCDKGKVQVVRETLVEDFKVLLKDFYLRISTPEELKREQREHQNPKRYFNAKPQDNESCSKSKKRKLAKAAKVQAPLKRKSLIKSRPLKSLS